MDKKKVYFQLVEGQVSTTYNNQEEIRYYNTVSLKLSSAAKASEVAKIAGIKHFRIEKVDENKSSWGEVIFTSPALELIEMRDKKEREAYNKDMAEKAAKINKLPERFDIATLAVDKDVLPKVTFFIRRGEATYDPHQSSRMQCSICLDIEFAPSTVERRPRIYLSDYINADRKKQYKKFIKDHDWWLGPYINSVNFKFEEADEARGKEFTYRRLLDSLFAKYHDVHYKVNHI